MARRSLEVDCYAVVAVTFAVATLFTVLRFWARHITKVKLWWDDWFAAAAFLTGLGFSAVAVAWTATGGLGQTFEMLDISKEEATRRSNLYLFNVELMYAFSLFCSKLAILGMYWRLFSTSQIRLPIQILGVMSIIWVIIRTFLTIFHCVPTQAFWDKSIKDARCDIDNAKFFFGTTLTHLLLDVAILVLPVMQVRQLKLRMGQKVGVIGLFMFGILVCIASLVLIILATKLDMHSSEITYDMSGIIIPATIEVNFAIVSACLPMMRPIVRHLLPGSVLGSASDPSSGRAYGKSGTHGGTGTGTGVKLRTMTTAIELEDDSSTKNFSDRNFTNRDPHDVETGSSNSSDDGQAYGHKTVIMSDRNTSGAKAQNDQNTAVGKGIHVKNEMSVQWVSGDSEHSPPDHAARLSRSP